MSLQPPTSTLFPYTTLFRSVSPERERRYDEDDAHARIHLIRLGTPPHPKDGQPVRWIADRGHERSPAVEPRSESTRLNSSHRTISYAVFCLKKKKNIIK